MSACVWAHTHHTFPNQEAGGLLGLGGSGLFSLASSGFIGGVESLPDLVSIVLPPKSSENRPVSLSPLLTWRVRCRVGPHVAGQEVSSAGSCLPLVRGGELWDLRPG